MLKMFDTESLFVRTTLWQILTSCVAIILVTNDVVFGIPAQLDVPFVERCNDSALLARH